MRDSPKDIPKDDEKKKKHIRAETMVVNTSSAAAMAPHSDLALQLPNLPGRDVCSPLLVSVCACLCFRSASTQWVPKLIMV